MYRLRRIDAELVGPFCFAKRPCYVALHTRLECRCWPKAIWAQLWHFASSAVPEKGAARTYRLELSSAVLSVFNFVSIRKSYGRKTPIGFIGFPAIYK